MNHRNGTKGQRLIELWSALQDRNTTVLRIVTLSTECGIDARRVLADHFQQGHGRA
ncbi:hypothetical protein A7J50_1168 [Pseudomonas antarctica]|uniref:Transposase n=1 Tax=Pseudomonas antarctica TaxID=219572 RepID=A0A172YWK4_9PSED|nr:hypothetical protein [Pseudomonas antarctica]ANF84607.1 hypothetical protein A7J50_1168 [Pseudomonas antarctica]